MNNTLEIAKKLINTIESQKACPEGLYRLTNPMDYESYSFQARINMVKEVLGGVGVEGIMTELRQEGYVGYHFIHDLEYALNRRDDSYYKSLLPNLEATLSGNKLKIVTELELTKRLVSYNSKILVELGFYENLEKYQLSAGYVCSRELMADRILRNAETQGLMDDLHQKGGAFENYRKNFEAAIYSSNCGRYVQMYANFIFESLEKNSRFGSVETKPIRSLANSFFGNRSVNKKFNTIINGIFHRSKST